MPDNVTDPDQVIAFLADSINVGDDPEQWSDNDKRRIRSLIDPYVEQLIPYELVDLITEAEKETKIVEEFIDTVCSLEDSAGSTPDLLTILQAMASFSLLRTAGLQPLAVAA